MIVYGNFLSDVDICEVDNTIHKNFIIDTWEVEDTSSGFKVFFIPAVNSEKECLAIAKQLNELGAEDVGFGTTKMLNAMMISKCEMWEFFNKLTFDSPFVDFRIRNISSEDNAYYVDCYSIDYQDGQKICSIFDLLGKEKSITVTYFFKILSDTALSEFRKLIDGKFKANEFSYKCGKHFLGSNWLEITTKSISATRQVSTILEKF